MHTALTYDDITLVPEYSEVSSRQMIDLTTQLSRRYKLKIPIIASPMDTVCESEMAIILADIGGVGCIHRFMTVEHQADDVRRVHDHIHARDEKSQENIPIMAAIGANGDFLERAQELVNNGANVILIDVAHGHHIHVKNALAVLKKELPPHVDIIAGNIATPQATIDLIDWGADALRVGIGGGCFTPSMRVETVDGSKPIVDVQVGDMVYTHTGESKEVIHKFEYDRNEEIMVINGIECTKNHEFYVVHNRHQQLVTDNNIHQYARWISAEELTDEFLLIEL